MSVNFYKFKKWFKMLSGKSLLHVDQGVGKAFVPGQVRGYYNDLTEKVLLDKETLEKKQLPKAKTDDGKDIIFATTIFQYGLGAYDLILQNGKQEYVEQFKKCIVWAIENQRENGGWDISAFAGKQAPYGAMAQGEGASLLIRAYLYFNEQKYLFAAKKAIDLMLTPIENGGTAVYEYDKITLLEFTDKPCVLNGWIFALFGLYDYIQATKEEQYIKLYERVLNTLCLSLNKFDNGYWSMYDCGGMIASPFYHKLHISQFKALCIVSDNPKIKQYLEIIDKYQNSKRCLYKAFLRKSIQKILEK